MILPTIEKELQLIRIGHKLIAGVDEVGRGPLAGPVAASAIIFDWTDKYKIVANKLENQKSSASRRSKSQKAGINLIGDSKLLSEIQREKAYKWIIENCLAWSVGIVSQEEIDRIGIRQASLKAMAEAVLGLSQKPDAVLIDGKDIIDFQRFAGGGKIDVYQESVIKGDRDIFSISAASIVAKVSRDTIMKKLDKVFPQYGFGLHKGYGTAAHRKAIEKHGLCRLHRRSFHIS
ncbi:MAG: ribonuclease HII [bacterium]